jgi:protein TonB
VKTRDQSPVSRYRRVAGGLLLLALALVVGYLLYSVFSKPAQSTKKRAVQEIALLKPPPPPPPPKTPPPPPPPRLDQQKIDVPKQDPTPDKPADAPPPGPDLAVDATGSGSGDGFGLVGKPGGTDLLATGTRGAVGNGFAWYGALVKERIQDAVSKDKKLRSASSYQRQVNVWISSTGAVTRVELIGPVENPALDEALRQALRNVAAVREGAPSDMPQPIRLRVSAQS